MATRSTRRNGPAPIPNERKRMLGNPGKRSLPDEASLAVLPGQAKPPAPPMPLGPLGETLWANAWAEARAWMAPSDVHALTLVCQALDEREALRQMVLDDPADWRNRAGLRAVDKQLMDGLSLLGFTPTDRTRLGVAEVRVEDDLEAFRRRQGVV